MNYQASPETSFNSQENQSTYIPPSPSTDDITSCIHDWRLEQLDASASTVEQYAGRLFRFQTWCIMHAHIARPASAETICEYLKSRSLEVQSNTLKSDVRAIRTGHACCNLDDPTQHTKIRKLAGYKVGNHSDQSEPKPSTAQIIKLHPSRKVLNDQYKSSGLSLLEIDDLSENFRNHALSANTIKAYADRLNDFAAFCHQHGLSPFPASVDTVVRFLTDYGTTRKPSTLRQARSAIRYIHKKKDISPLPTEPEVVQEVLDGHARQVGTAPDQKDPLSAEDITRMSAKMDEEGGAHALRDKAMLLLAFSGAFRRSEITRRVDHDDMPKIYLAIEDIKFTRHGANIMLRKSKTDQESEGQEVFVTYSANPKTCAVLTLQEWIEFLESKGITSGPLFRGMRPTGDRAKGDAKVKPNAMAPESYVARLKLWSKLAGIDPARIGGHSLRSGHVTTAGTNGASPFSIAKQGRWKNLNTVLGYFRTITAHKDNSSSQLWK